MKNEYINKNIISITGTLDIDEETDTMFIHIETKDSVENINLNELLNSLLGREIQIKSEEDI